MVHPPTPRNVGNNFSHCERNYAMRLASVDAQCSMARSFLNARNSHLASIKCKKTFGGWGSVPDPLGEFAPDSFPRKQAHST